MNFAVMEIVELICEMVYYMVYRRPMQIARRKRRHDNMLMRRPIRYQADNASIFSKTVDQSMTIESNLDLEDIEMIDYSLRH